ncbi:MAG: hypothetical protein ABF290_16490 [Thiogranum sp.]
MQANRRRRSEVNAQPAAVRGTWVKALAAFEGRLHWYCHFIQTLESEPRIEFENLHRACDNLREGEFDPESFEAMSRAATGSVSGLSSHGLRTGYSSRAVADAGGYYRYQHLLDLQPGQAVAGSGPVGPLYPAMDAGAGAAPGPLDSYTMGDG